MTFSALFLLPSQFLHKMIKDIEWGEIVINALLRDRCHPQYRRVKEYKQYRVQRGLSLKEAGLACGICSLEHPITRSTWKRPHRNLTFSLEKYRNKVGGLTLPDFKNCCAPAVIKTVWHWQNKQAPQNSIESSQIGPRKCIRSVLEKGAKATQWNKDGVFNKWYQSKWTPRGKH